MSEPKLGWDTGTTKLQTYSESQAELINDLQAKVYSREIENKRMREALQDIIDSKECEVCKCKQKMGHTYDGIMFIHLHKIAERALKNG